MIGGAGYIGLHMMLAHQDAGYSDVVFGILSRGFADAVGSAPLVISDLRSPTDLDTCLDAQNVDLVMHFAALAYVDESVMEPELYYQNKVVGALNLLVAKRRHGVNRLVFPSTCATGEPKFVPISESHAQRPINPYDRMKWTIKQSLRDYALAYGTQSSSNRGTT